MDVRVRFAPSPTGKVHIGNIRVAIFNWLFARHQGGKFLLRVEDTDLERSTPEAIEALLESMAWLGLDYDEDAYYQAAAADEHRAAAERLISEGKAYSYSRSDDEAPATYFRIPYNPDFRGHIRTVGAQVAEVHPEIPVEIAPTGIRFAMASRKGKPMPMEGCLAGYRDLRVFNADGQCVFQLADEINAILGGKSVSITDATRLEYMRTEVFYTDLVKGELSKPLDSMKDLVIVRSNGSPVFHLANVCDDIIQKVTHIIRGNDHVENTYRHIFLFDALGYKLPQYAHLPMIVNHEGKPYSKRDGDAYVGDFRQKGFNPDALFNYLAFLGWNPGDEREKMTRSEMVEAFTLDRVKSTAAQMDIRKLSHLNGQYLNELPLVEFAAAAKEAIAVHDWAAGMDEGYFQRICALLQSRTNLYEDVADWAYFFVADLVYDEKSVRKALCKEGRKEAFQWLVAELETSEFTEGALEAAIHRVENAAGLGEGTLNQPIRVAVTGIPRGAGIYETMVILGRERVLSRLAYAIKALFE